MGQVAQSTQTVYHALIDTGALVTGVSNFEVAAFLLDHGCENMKGVAFVDELSGAKRILLRGHAFSFL